MYLLDTNVCIRFLNKSSPELTLKLIGTDPDEIFLCSIVKAELFYGAHKSNNPLKTLKAQKEFCNRFKSLPFDDSAAEVYGEIRSSLEKKGRIIGPNDLIIASIAKANDLILITHNGKEFNRVEGLTVEDWQE
jgi:tRNA(fMet)-specific endonuclease VapC